MIKQQINKKRRKEEQLTRAISQRQKMDRGVKRKGGSDQQTERYKTYIWQEDPPRAYETSCTKLHYLIYTCLFVLPRAWFCASRPVCMSSPGETHHKTPAAQSPSAILPGLRTVVGPRLAILHIPERYRSWATPDSSWQRGVRVRGVGTDRPVMDRGRM